MASVASLGRSLCLTLFAGMVIAVPARAHRWDPELDPAFAELSADGKVSALVDYGNAGGPTLLLPSRFVPNQSVYFVAPCTRGPGIYLLAQLTPSLDLNQPHLAGFSIADEQGKASLVRTLPPNSSGRSIFLQAAEQGRKSEVVEALIE